MFNILLEVLATATRPGGKKKTSIHFGKETVNVSSFAVNMMYMYKNLMMSTQTTRMNEPSKVTAYKDNIQKWVVHFI